MELITDVSLWELVKHLQSWLSNLRRAKSKRKEESKQALRQVILASRATYTYVRSVNETGKQSHAEEGRLSSEWTKLSFKLEDLGLSKLAKRCDIKGRYWSNPDQFDPAFLDKADIKLAQMEKLAQQTLAEIER